jgi:serine/threonine protein kinase
VSSNLLGGKYEILDVLGRGVAGTVYAAKDVQTGERVAVKSLHALVTNSPDDPEFRRFAREARIGGSVESPHIAKVFDIGTDSDTGEMFLVMESLEGEDGEALLGRLGPLPPSVALRIAADACLGLEAAHARGVVHRDVKPGNLFLVRRENGEIFIKILDFGVAKIRRMGPEEQKSGLTVSKLPMTASGQYLGTPLYMSPEHVEGARHVDAQSDVFSLGVTLYALLTGAPPNADCTSFVDLLFHITQGKHHPVREVAPWVPEDIAAIVEKAMRVSRAERFANIRAMYDAILSVLPNDFQLHVDVLVEADRTPIASISPAALPKDSDVMVREQNPASRKSFVAGVVFLSLMGVVGVVVFLLQH